MDPLAAPDPGNVTPGDTFMWMFTSAAERVGDWWSAKSPASTWGRQRLGFACGEIRKLQRCPSVAEYGVARAKSHRRIGRTRARRRSSRSPDPMAVAAGARILADHPPVDCGRSKPHQREHAMSPVVTSVLLTVAVSVGVTAPDIDNQRAQESGSTPRSSVRPDRRR